MVCALSLIILLLVGLAGSSAYFNFASKHGPYANPNFRSLHQKAVPRGGGLVIALTTLLGLSFLGWREVLSPRECVIYLLGGGGVALVGFSDDRFDLSARYRLPLQILVAGWTVAWFGGCPPLDLGGATINLGVVGAVLLAGWCVWFYNLYNFIDGIDGLAATAAIFVCLAMGSVLALRHLYPLAWILGLLAMANLGFLAFNWPPARMFMGDSGTSFSSFVFSAVGVASLWRDTRMVWIWLIAFAVYFADTTTTTLTRFFTVPQWYRPHRSHAYQNLARIWGDHRRVVLLVLAIDLGWVVPALIFALWHQAWAPLIALVTYLPLILLSMRFGPRFKNE
jgi:Fuc2NAc and GlcNAc transferase